MHLRDQKFCCDFYRMFSRCFSRYPASLRYLLEFSRCIHWAYPKNNTPFNKYRSVVRQKQLENKWNIMWIERNQFELTPNSYHIDPHITLQLSPLFPRVFDQFSQRTTGEGLSYPTIGKLTRNVQMLSISALHEHPYVFGYMKDGSFGICDGLIITHQPNGVAKENFLPPLGV